METREPRALLVLVTAPDLETARRLAKAALNERLVACANIASQVESHYWWQNSLESANETPIHFKTMPARVRALERLITEAHPYDVPEFVCLEIQDGSAAYLEWVNQECSAQSTENQ